MTSLQKINNLLREAERIAEYELGVTNIFYNEAFVEAFMADQLGHRWNVDTQGSDAYEPDGTPTEYKAINVRGKYKGTFQFHWLSENKMDKLRTTKNMYFAIRDGVELKEVYSVPTDKLIDKIQEKATNSKSTNGHISFTLEQIKKIAVPHKLQDNICNE